MNLERIDNENHEFYKETLHEVESGKFSLKDIIGFDIEGTSVFIPRVPCRHINPSKEICKSAERGGISSLFTLAPVYDSLIYPISTEYQGAQINEKTFEKLNNISMKDFLLFVEQKRVIPYFENRYSIYDSDFIENFLEPGLPRISIWHAELLTRMNACKIIGNDCKKCEGYVKSAETDMRKIRPNLKEEEFSWCSYCLYSLYSLGIDRETILKSKNAGVTICALKDIVISRNMNSVIQSNCPIAKKALGFFTGVGDTIEAIDLIVKGLKINYSNDIDITSYLHFLDGKTTKAVRQIIAKIMEDPYAMKYSERLNAKLCDLNAEIQEIGKTRWAKFYQAVSDIAVYGGSKYVELQSGNVVKPQKRDLNRVSEWIASKLIDVHAKVTKRDWTLAQVYKTRTKIGKCIEDSPRVDT